MVQVLICSPAAKDVREHKNTVFGDQPVLYNTISVIQYRWSEFRMFIQYYCPLRYDQELHLKNSAHISF